MANSLEIHKEDYNRFRSLEISFIQPANEIEGDQKSKNHDFYHVIFGKRRNHNFLLFSNWGWNQIDFLRKKNASSMYISMATQNGLDVRKYSIDFCRLL